MSKSDAGTPLKYRLLEFVEEGDGSLSATRLGFLLWVIGVLVVWGIDSVTNKSLEAVPQEVVTVIGILMTGKVVQKFGEKAADDDPSLPAQNGDKANTPKRQKPEGNGA